jgi:hypothetical protein
MKKIVKILSLASIFVAFSANADIELKDNSEILGKWDLHDEAISLTAPKKHTDTAWDIKSDGTIDAESSDKSGRVGATKITIKYSVEDGKIKKQSRPGKELYETCTIVEKDDKDMILHCGYYFFLTRK